MYEFEDHIMKCRCCKGLLTAERRETGHDICCSCEMKAVRDQRGKKAIISKGQRRLL
jgi:hypothetical protein